MINPERIRSAREGQEQKEQEVQAPENLQEAAQQAERALGKAAKYLGLKSVGSMERRLSGENFICELSGMYEGKYMGVRGTVSEDGRVKLEVLGADGLSLIRLDLSEPTLSNTSLEELVQRAKKLRERYLLEVEESRFWKFGRTKALEEINKVYHGGAFTPQQIEAVEQILEEVDG